MSALRAGSVRQLMDTRALSSASRFACVREAFHTLVELDSAPRDAQLKALEAEDEALGSELRALLNAFDSADLYPLDDAAEVAGLQFGPFTVLRRLGSGGMGEVFLAERHDQGFDQLVAVKRAHRMGISSELTRRFLRERHLLGRLDHPGIARLIDGGVSVDGRPWLAMEYVDGVHLLAHAQAQKLDLHQRVALFRGVCAAVAYAHRNLILHRDLKPANVLVNAAGQSKLLDFGIAKLLDDSEADLTRPQSRLLTVRYAAPEQVAGERTTTATDMYALGVLLFELLTGHSPYSDVGTDGDWTRAVLHAPMRPLNGLMTGYVRKERGRWPDLERILRKALAKPPTERYAGVTAFDADLDDWLHARPLRSGIGSATAQTRYLLQRYRWPLAMFAAIVVALGAGLGLAWAQAQRAERAAALAEVHLKAALEVLGAANPGYFAGREPTASEFLLTAAKRIVVDHSEQPALRRRALTEIGHGLLNLGQFESAREVLQWARSAAVQDAAGGVAGQLSVLGLLIETQTESRARGSARATAAQIEDLARSVTAPMPSLLDALTRAGAAMGRLGEFEYSDRLFALAQAYIARTEARRATAQPTQIENFWRQRGWAALRNNDGVAAAGYLDQADAVIAISGAQIGTLRRAEADLLQAQAALLVGNAAKALSRLNRARPVIEDEYPLNHPERAAFDLLDAQISVQQGRLDNADFLASAALRKLTVRGYERDQATAELLLAQTSAVLGRCGLAATHLQAGIALLVDVQALLPREHARLEASKARVAEACATTTALPDASHF